MATFTKFYCLTEDLAGGKHNLGSDAIKIMLTNVAPNVATHTVKTDITEITPGFGYSAGGTTAAIASSSQTLGVYKLVLDDVTFTASGGTMATFRYAVAYNDTSVTKPLIGYYDKGSAIALVDPDFCLVDFSAATGVLTLT
jgi:hypothetical protein